MTPRCSCSRPANPLRMSAAWRARGLRSSPLRVGLTQRSPAPELVGAAVGGNGAAEAIVAEVVTGCRGIGFGRR